VVLTKRTIPVAILFVGPAKGANLSSLGPLEGIPSLFLLFLREIISDGRSFSAGILGPMAE